MLWPDVSALKLYEMTLSFAALTESKVSAARQQLARAATELLGRELDSALVVTAALEAQTIYNQAPEADRWTQALFDEILRAIQTRLGLASEGEATELWGRLGAYSESTDENQVIVVLACTFLERLLGDVLAVLGVTSGMSYSQAEKKIFKDLQSITQRNRFFAQRTGMSLGDAFSALGHQPLWDGWNTIRKRRNDFIHGLPWAPWVISVETAQTAIAIAEQAIPALARLQNAYCIRQPRQSEPGE